VFTEKNRGLLGAGAHAYNPSYSGSRDQEDLGSKLVRQKKKKKKKKNSQKGLAEWVKVKALSSNPSTGKTNQNPGVFKPHTLPLGGIFFVPVSALQVAVSLKHGV
jgi:hypothetical protein